MVDHELEDRLSRIASQVADAQRNAEVARTLRAEVDALEVEGSSRGREVTVVVDAAGRLRDVSFHPSCVGLSQDRLSAVTMEAVSVARTAVSSKVESLVDKHVGADTSLGQAMLEAYREVAGPPPRRGGQQQDGPEGPHRRPSGPGPGLFYPGM